MRTDEAIRELTEVIKNKQGGDGGDTPSGSGTVWIEYTDNESTDIGMSYNDLMECFTNKKEVVIVATDPNNTYPTYSYLRLASLFQATDDPLYMAVFIGYSMIDQQVISIPFLSLSESEPMQRSE